MSSTLLLGHIIKGRYKLIDERGSGTFGAVYIARDLQNNYLYAAKILHLDHAFDSELLERFKREAYILHRWPKLQVLHTNLWSNGTTTRFELCAASRRRTGRYI